MKISGSYKKVGRWFAAEVPLLLISTQARTKKELVDMIVDALKAIVDSGEFKADVSLIGDNGIIVGAKAGEKLLLATALRQQRAASQKTVRDVALELGSNSPNSYARYESGKVKINFDKFSQLLSAINGCEPVLSIIIKP